MIVAFDFGSKNIGVAVSDPEEIFSFAKCSISTSEFLQNPDLLVEKVPQIKDASLLLVGLPVNLKNQTTLSTDHAVTFCKSLQELFPDKSVQMYDERMTSSIVSRRQSSQKKHTKQQTKELREKKDMYEAQILLQDFLRRRENEKEQNNQE